MNKWMDEWMDESVIIMFIKFNILLIYIFNIKFYNNNYKKKKKYRLESELNLLK